MPLSRDEEARSRQLKNLRRGGPPAAAGNALAATHRGYSAVSAREQDAKARAVYDALAADAPLRAPDGGLPRSDSMVVGLLARCLVRLERVEDDMDAHGWRDRESGEARPVVELEGKLRREALDYARELGMTPRSRLALGLDLQRGFDLAQAMAADGEAERRNGGDGA